MTLASCDLSTFLQLRPLAQPVASYPLLQQLEQLILTWPTKITKCASRKTQPRAECAMPPSEPILPQALLPQLMSSEFVEDPSQRISLKR